MYFAIWVISCVVALSFISFDLASQVVREFFLVGYVFLSCQVLFSRRIASCLLAYLHVTLWVVY